MVHVLFLYLFYFPFVVASVYFFVLREEPEEKMPPNANANTNRPTVGNNFAPYSVPKIVSAIPLFNTFGVLYPGSLAKRKYFLPLGTLTTEKSPKTTCATSSGVDGVTATFSPLSQFAGVATGYSSVSCNESTTLKIS